MRLLTVILASLLLGLPFISGTSQAGDLPQSPAWPSPNWDRDLALVAESLVERDAMNSRLLHLATPAGSPELLKLLQQVGSRADWPAPAREAALLEFTNHLRQLPLFSVSAPVLDFLRSYPVQTLVSHEEAVDYGIAMYPINAAAQGVLHQWTREKARQEASALLGGREPELVDVYAANNDRNIRAGIELALADAGPGSLRRILEYGLPLLTEHQALTGLLGRSAIYLEDARNVSTVLAVGGGPGLVQIIREAGSRLSKQELGQILLSGLDSAPPPTASLLIAELAPYSIHIEAVSARLLSILDSPELGSTAVLAVAQWGSPAQRESLLARARKDSGGQLARRVETALSLDRARHASQAR